jgi:hypothetical protein
MQDFFFHFFFFFYVEQYKAEAPYRENSKLSLKRVKREQTEEEAGSHRGLCATKPPKEWGGSFCFALAVCAIFAPVILGLGLGMERSSLLLGRAPSVPEAGVARLYGRDDCQASPSAL